MNDEEIEDSESFVVLNTPRPSPIVPHGQEVTIRIFEATFKTQGDGKQKLSQLVEQALRKNSDEVRTLTGHGPMDAMDYMVSNETPWEMTWHLTT